MKIGLRQSYAAEKGVGLIEVLVTILVVAIALLGTMGLHAKTLQAQFEAYQRIQALALLDDMVNRLRANKAAAACYNVASVGTGDDAANYTCDIAGSIALGTTAIRDIQQWAALLQGAAETKQIGADKVGAMIDARGCISGSSDNTQFTISVAWQAETDSVVPSNTCGQGKYTADTKRRVLSATVRFSNLSDKTL